MAFFSNSYMGNMMNIVPCLINCIWHIGHWGIHTQLTSHEWMKEKSYTRGLHSVIYTPSEKFLGLDQRYVSKLEKTRNTLQVISIFIFCASKQRWLEIILIFTQVRFLRISFTAQHFTTLHLNWIFDNNCTAIYFNFFLCRFVLLFFFA